MSKRKRQHPHAHLLDLYDAMALEARRPPTWPGVSDPSLAHPDDIKFELAEFASKQEPGQSKLEAFEIALSQGPLGQLPEIEHWATEEFFWHGLPGDDWHPLEAYLAAAGERFPVPAQAQLRRWKEAQIGLYEVGDVADDTVGLQEWDAVAGAYCGPALRAIALNIGGVQFYGGLRRQITLTYVAPWDPAQNLFCAMGYGVTGKKRSAPFYALMLALRQPKIASQPYPWKVDTEVADRYLRQWRQREWHGWLQERLVFPFQAWVRTSERGDLAVLSATELAPMTPDEARNLGVYLVADLKASEGKMIAGLTNIIPLEIDSPNWGPIAEYQAYRERVGPPPGTVGQPPIMRIR